MTLYQIEKKRLHASYYYIIMVIILYVYFIQAQTQASIQTYGLNADGLTAAVEPVSFWHPAFWAGLAIETVYLNFRLFWIRERDQLSFLLRKYDTLPILKRDLYMAKAKVMLKIFGIYMVLSIIIYYFVIFTMFGTKAIWVPSISQIILSIVLGLCIILALLGIDWLQDILTSE